MYTKTISIVSVRGNKLPDEALAYLKQFGIVRIISEDIVEIVPAPPPVAKDEKFYRHRRDQFWITLFRKFVEEGFTLFFDETSKIWVRITERKTYIFAIDEHDMGSFAVLDTRIFQNEFSRKEEFKLSIWDMFASGTFVFDDFLANIDLEEALYRMNWNGLPPSTYGQEPPYFNNERGQFSAKKFLGLYNAGFRIFNDRNLTRVIIDDDKTYIFMLHKMENDVAVYAVVDTPDFLDAFPSAWGAALHKRLGSVLRKDLKFIQNERLPKDRALVIMHWEERIREGGSNGS